MATAMTTNDPAVDRLVELERDVEGLPARWLPRAGELREFAVRWLEGWNTHNLDLLESLVTDDIVWEDPAMLGETVHGRAEFRAFTKLLFDGIPDVHFEGIGTPYLDLEGTGIGLRWRMTGTMTGDLGFWGKRFGENPPAFAPTGRSVDLEGVDLYELRDGLVARWTIVYDMFELSRQLGLMPAVDGRMLPLVLRGQRLAAALMRRR